MSVMATWVLLKVARILATPTAMFLDPFALMIFLALGSSPRSSAAVGAAAATGAAFAASAAGAAAGLSGPSPAGFAAFSGAGLPSFFDSDFFGFVSSAITNQLVDAGLGVGIALHADGLPRALARAVIGAGTLASHREAAQVTDPSVA